jgi:hypothetical protein
MSLIGRQKLVLRFSERENEGGVIFNYACLSFKRFMDILALDSSEDRRLKIAEISLKSSSFKKPLNLADK